MAGYIGNFPTALPLSGTDIADGTITNSDLANSSVTVNGTSISLGASGTISAGITEADSFVLSTNVQQASGLNDLTTNFARESVDSFSQIGTGMTESSGIFTFPSTGLYHVSCVGAFLTNNGAVAFASLRIKSTTDNSTYTTRASAYTSSSGNNEYCSSYNYYLFNVTNVSTHKIKFETEFSASTRLNTSATRFIFIRLGDSQ